VQVKEEGIAYSIPINSGRSFNNSTYTPGREEKLSHESDVYPTALHLAKMCLESYSGI